MTAVCASLCLLIGAITAESRRHHVPRAMMHAIAWRESRYRQAARGRAGEVGIMQIAPKSAALWCKELDTTDARENIRCGARLLRMAHRKCPSNPLTAYWKPAKCGPSPYEAKIKGAM